MQKERPLSRLLLVSWQSFANEVHRSRLKTTTKNVHGLRISSQRLEAVLTLARTLEARGESKHVVRLIKNLRRSLSPLRDIQVESLALKNFQFKENADAKMNDYFSKRKKQAKSKAIRSLNGISLRKSKVRIDKLADTLMQTEAIKSKREITRLLKLRLEKTSNRFKQLLQTLNPKNIEQIHKFRIHVKKFKYQQECMNSMLADSRPRSKNPQKLVIGRLARIQSTAGRIQNDSILINNLDRFLSSPNGRDDKSAMKIRQHVKSSRSNKIKTQFTKLATVPWQN